MKDKHIKAYMECAEAFAKCSPARRLKVGSVLVKNNRIISCGYNALAEHVNGDCEDENGKTRPEVRHSEANALKGLIKSSESAVGATLFCTHSSCKMCAIDIVDAGITKVVYKTEFRESDGIEYLRNNGVEVVKYEEEI
ncbi:MAG: putative ComE operon protein 2 [Prokaryotic dsDNA virus sp.]|nr:MAG: putative ComE operon protein 2 [Prokaryotic dsDNA virus sp.]|tara:strand:- start:90505 stop:90921 length:417 start_codon:yes stop_codon:yes gene_type:complete